MDTAAETLLRELESSPTDLKKLVVSALWRRRSAIMIESEAVARWERDDPQRWASVQEWLLARGVTITVLRRRAAAASPRVAPLATSPPPSAALGG